MALPAVRTAVLGTIYSLSIILALVGNTILLVGILRSKNLRGVSSNYLLVSVLVARDLIAVCVIPVELFALFDMEKILGPFLCQLCAFAAGASTTATAYSLALLAFERMRSLKIKKDFFTSKWHFVAYMLVIWVSSCIYNCTPFLSAGLFNSTNAITGEETWSCGTHPAFFRVNQILAIADTIVACFIPLTIVVVSFWQTGAILMRNIKYESHVQPTPRGANEANDGETGGITTMPQKEAVRTLEMSLVMVIIFAICTLAPYIARILAMWFRIYNDIAMQTIIVLMFTNPWVTWIIFLMYRKDLRHAVNEAFGRNTTPATSPDVQ